MNTSSAMQTYTTARVEMQAGQRLAVAQAQGRNHCRTCEERVRRFEVARMRRLGRRRLVGALSFGALIRQISTRDQFARIPQIVNASVSALGARSKAIARALGPVTPRIRANVRVQLPRDGRSNRGGSGESPDHPGSHQGRGFRSKARTWSRVHSQPSS